MRSTLALTALVALVLSGCSEERLTKQEYLERGREIQFSALEAERLFFRLASGDVSSRECTDGSRRFHDEVDRIVGDIAGLRPPKEIEGIHERVVSAWEESVVALDTLADDVAAGEVSCGREWNRRAYGLDSTRRGEAALQELEEQGYEFLSP